MNIRDFTYLINLAKTNHFGQAAELSFVSQPTLSIQIKKLEQTLGCQLIERQGKKACLTDAGKLAVKRAEQILLQIKDLKQEMLSFQDPLSGDWKVGIFPTLAPYLLPKIITNLKRKLPNLNLQLYEAITENCIKELTEGNWDAIIIADKIDDNQLSRKKLFREDFVLAAPKNHPLAKETIVKASQIPEDEILLLENGHCLRDQSIEYCRRIKKNPGTNFGATSLETLISMVALGEGITFIPELSIRTFKQYPIKILPMKPTPFRDIYLYWRKSCCRETCAEMFESVLVQSVDT